MRIRCRGIRLRIYSGTGILVALGLLLAAVAVTELASVGRQVATMAVRSTENARILEVERLLEITGRSALGYWLSGDAAILKQGSEADTTAETLLKQAMATTPSEDERRVFRTVMNGIEEFRRTRNVLVIMTDEVAGLRRDLADGGDTLVGQGAQFADAAAATGDHALTMQAWSTEKSLLQMRSDAWRFFADPDPQRQAAFKASAEQAMAAIGHLQDMELSDELQSQIASVGAALAAYASNFDQLSEEVLQQRELFEQQMRPQIDHLLTMVRGAADTQQRNLDSIKHATDTLIGKTILAQKSLAGLGFGVGLLIALLVCRGIIRPLAGMTAAMGKLAKGDTAIDIPSRTAKDEMGAMAAAVEVFRQNAIARAELEAAQEEQQKRATQERRAALTNMADTIERDSASALEGVGRRTAAMEATADAMAASAERTGAAAQNAAAAATEAEATAQTVASAAEQLAASVKEIGGQASQSTEVVNRAINAGQATRRAIEALNERVARIGAVADMIREIAARTNLLALNATIEAARAGEAGKGFAVVANEVKQLATQTARSTEEISQQITEVRAATGTSVVAVDHIEHTIGEINAIASSIAAAVEEQGAATAEIARSIAESAAAVNDIAKQANQVSGEAGMTNRYATDLRSDAAGLDTAVRELKHAVVKVVRTSTNEVDRRQHSRRTVDLPCRLVAAGQAPQAAQVTDLSEEGACVQDGPPMLTGAGGTLQIEGLDMALPFAVRYAAGRVLHLAFDADDTVVPALRAFLDALPQTQVA